MCGYIYFDSSQVFVCIAAAGAKRGTKLVFIMHAHFCLTSCKLLRSDPHLDTGMHTI